MGTQQGQARVKKLVAVILLFAAIAAGAIIIVRLPNLAELVIQGEHREIREGRPKPSESTEAGPKAPKLLLIAMDGVDRSLLYDELEGGRLPGLAALVGGRAPNGELHHAHLDRTLLSTLPSTTMTAWATVMTGAPPAEHGVTGNEYFIRETRRLAAPAPVTFSDPSPALRIYTDGYANALLSAQTVWQRMRETYPDAVIWSSMLPFYAGVDLLLTAKRTVVATAFEAFLTAALDEHAAPRPVYAALDTEAIDTVIDELEERTAPDVLVVYLPGIDLYAHRAEMGSDAGRRGYLRDVIDPALDELRESLARRDELSSRWVLVVSDHGHTDVLHDDRHALSTEGDDEPPEVLRRAHFRVRPFQLDVDQSANFQSVLAYQGAMAFVYVADRTTCARPGQACDWSSPPRFEADVLAAAEAFYAASASGTSAMHGTLDLVLARRPRRAPEVDLPFEVYTGAGRLVRVEDYLKKHPEPRYVALATRLRDLAVGVHGERAGDVLLIAHNGDRDRARDRYYFASKYRSWHGSPSRQDSEVPLIVARSDRSASDLAEMVQKVLGPVPRQQKVTDLVLQLRR